VTGDLNMRSELMGVFRLNCEVVHVGDPSRATILLSQEELPDLD
jgi:hypothetical protein